MNLLIALTAAAGLVLADDRSIAAAEGGGPSVAGQESRPDTAGRNATPIVIAKMLLVDEQGNRAGVMFQFAVQDVDKVEENRALAVRLLPDAIRYAE